MSHQLLGQPVLSQCVTIVFPYIMCCLNKNIGSLIILKPETETRLGQFAFTLNLKIPSIYIQRVVSVYDYLMDLSGAVQLT